MALGRCVIVMLFLAVAAVCGCEPSIATGRLDRGEPGEAIEQTPAPSSHEVATEDVPERRDADL